MLYLNDLDKALVSKLLRNDRSATPILDLAENGFASIADGITRRILLDDPAELALSIVIHNWEQWDAYANARKKNRIPDHLWREILLSAATHDWRFVEASLLHFPERSCGDPTRSLESFIFERLLTIMRGPSTIDSIFASNYPRGIPKTIITIADCLDAIARRDPVQFAENLNTQIVTTRRARDLRTEDRLIDLFAHGLWEVGKRVDPAVVALWSPETSLPWDQGFYTYTRSVNEAIEVFRPVLAGRKLEKICQYRSLRVDLA